MWRQPLFRYVIEIVTDVPVEIDAAHDVVTYVVPPDYETRRGSRFKARALHYALELSQLPDDSWIVHLDEETQPTPSGIRGIARMIQEEERTGQLRVGQGAILYHRHWTRHPLLTLADMQRTGDDHARFHVQQRLGRTLFGLHGSFIVVRNDIEKTIGFDFGPEGSVTEDSWWALVLTSSGHRTRWVDGYLEEQSCRSYEDLVRQRRRWFVGLWLVARHAPVKRRHSAALTASVLIWTVAPLSALYTIARLLITSYYVPPWLRLLADVSFAIHLTVNLIGLRVNLAEEGRLSRPMRLLAYATLIVLFPFYLLLECAGVVYGMFDRDYGFHVVEK
jgi:egghead protein (zeste-white 4 protein)